MCGVRPISNIVDITNYVLLELGQPMHAFDLAKLRGGVIKVRRAKRAARRSRRSTARRARSTPDMLVIADAERAEAIGGVMGGADSEVTNAHQAHRVRGGVLQARVGARDQQGARAQDRSVDALRARHGHHRAAARAMARACELLEQIGAGKAAGDHSRCLSGAAAAEDDASRSSTYRAACSAWTCLMRTSSAS